MTSDSPIPLFDPLVQFRDLKTELLSAAERVLSSGSYILGEEVAAFESEVASYLGVTHAVGVNSGTDALTIALRAVGVSPGSEVITSTFTFFATAESICQAGATPVFADIDPATFNIDPLSIEKVITDRTAAIVPVHLFGRPAPMGEILGIGKTTGVPVVEDAAQAFGASIDGRRAGTMGDAAAFSFFPSKNLSGFGDGGLIATDDDGVAAAAEMLRVHGARRKYFNEVIGYNSRLDSLQAALLSVKLPHVDRWNQQRRSAGVFYNDLLRDCSNVVLPESSRGDVCHQYTVRIGNGQRDHVVKRLQEASISTAIYYPVPLHLLPAFEQLPQQGLPHAEQAAEEVLSLPMWPGIGHDVQQRVAAAVQHALSS